MEGVQGALGGTGDMPVPMLDKDRDKLMVKHRAVQVARDRSEEDRVPVHVRAVRPRDGLHSQAAATLAPAQVADRAAVDARAVAAEIVAVRVATVDRVAVRGAAKAQAATHPASRWSSRVRSRANRSLKRCKKDKSPCDRFRT